MSTAVASPWVVALAELPAVVPGSPESVRRSARIGRKALSLGELMAAGVPVPDAVVVTTEAYEAMLATEVVASQLAEGLEAVRAALLQAPLPDGLAEAVREGMARLGDGPMAVRSSGTSEDLEGASFAGQYETCLNVVGPAAILLALRRCWASAWTERVEVYATSKGLGREALGMGVVIQQQVDAEVSGVLFTLDPATGLQEHHRVEACLGLGEALVGGLVTPDRFVVDHRDRRVVEEQVAVQEIALRRAPGGGVEERTLLPAEGGRPTLDADRLAELSTLGRRIQAFYGAPQDIEWVLASDRIRIVQSRPITAVSYTGIEGEWTTADFKDGGVSARVCSPYMWSLYDSIWQRSMPTYLRRLRLLRHEDPIIWGRVFYGRPYWNLGELKRVLNLVPGFNERSFDTDLGIEPLYEGDGTVIPYSPMVVLKALPILFAMNKDYRERLEICRAFVAGFPEREAVYEAPPSDLDDTALFARIRHLLTVDYQETEHAYFMTIYNTSNAKIDFKATLDKLQPRLGREISWLDLLSGLQDVRHLHPLRDLSDMAARVRQDEALHACILAHRGADLLPVLEAEHPAFHVELLEFLRHYRHHGVAELDITQPRWDEDPSFVVETLAAFVEGYDEARTPEAISERQRQRFEQVRDEVVGALGGVFRRSARNGFLRNLERVRTYMWWREEMRDTSSRIYAIIRRETLEVARRLVASGTLDAVEEVWFLRWPELLELLDGTLSAEDARARIRDRDEELAGWRNYTNPNELGQRFAIGGRAPRHTEDGALCGIGCSAGRVTARVRVAPTIQDATHLEAGEILVTRFTDPGWTTLFGQIAGVVTETGGVLSHAAVIAREYGIPAVLAVPGATDQLSSGQWVEIDGGNGTVRVVDGPG